MYVHLSGCVGVAMALCGYLHIMHIISKVSHEPGPVSFDYNKPLHYVNIALPVCRPCSDAE